jgi:hypothetical protein
MNYVFHFLIPAMHVPDGHIFCIFHVFFFACFPTCLTFIPGHSPQTRMCHDWQLVRLTRIIIQLPYVYKREK